MNQSLPIGKVLTLLCATSMALASYAQRTPDAARQHILQDPKAVAASISEERGTPSFIAVKANGAGYSKSQARSALANYVGIRSGIDDLVAKREIRLFGDKEVLEFHQYYKGIKVEHSRFTALVSNGEVLFFNGAFYNVPASLPTQGRLSKSEALNRAKGRVNAKKYAWELMEEKIRQEKNLGAKAVLAIELSEYQPEGELVVVKDFNKQGIAEMRLAYKFNIYAFEPLSRDWVYIDAEDGKILLVDKIIKHADNPGSPSSSSVTTMVQTRYAGTREIKTKQVIGNDPNSGLPLLSSNPLEVYVPGGSTYALIDDSRGGGIETYDLNGVGGLPISLAPAYSQAKSFTDVNNNWTLAEHVRGSAAESENDDIAWDAHWGAGVVYDYWKIKQNRLSFDGNDAKIKSYIHSGVGYDNAFWNGRVMTYGDGSFPAPGGFRPLTSLDVCAHEIGHGVCTFTADLVYEKESGAMNEGYSDIWAACAEYYAIKRVDPALAALYKPFFIGEQIAANPARPLRRMDSPKAEGDPDTYGGTNWRNPDCSPSLANDQCGVHTNSGVLNKWFYLMTVGSGAGSGPDAAFAGEDDEINDKGNRYAVSGLGFDLAERIAYLTELMLTSTAKFEEARAVSIQVAAAMSGNPCSAVVKSVTDAWYAVGVGEAFVQPCTITYGFVYQPGGFVSEGQSGAGCDAEQALAVPFVLPPNASASITVSGTATNQTDYRLSATSFTNNTTNSRQDSVIIYVKNDAVVESDETVILNLSVTNVGSNPLNKTYTLNIVEDDVTPVISSGTKQLLSETFTRGDGFADPAGWKEILEVPEEPNGTQAAKGKNQWGIFGNKLAITGRDELTGLPLPNGLYNNNSISQTIISSPLIDARGLNTLQLKFDFSVQGEVDPAGTDPSQFPALDYMAIVYSFDGNTWYELAQPPFVRFASAQPANGVFDNLLPSFLNNKQFFLGFRWYNDPLIGGPVSVSLDNLSLNGSARKIENQLQHHSRENLGAGQDVYFYSIQDGEIISRIKNDFNKSFGCTNTFIEKAGNGTFNLYQGKDGLHKVADKVVRIEAALIYKAPATVTLFYTEAQLQALELVTGAYRNAFSLFQVNAPAYTGATANNTKKYSTVYTPLPGVGGTYTISFNERLNGSYALGYTVSVFGQVTDAITMNPMQLQGEAWKFEPLFPTPAAQTMQLFVTVPELVNLQVELVNASGQVVHTAVQKLNAGKTAVRLTVNRFAAGSYQMRIRDEKGALLHSQLFVKQ